MKTVIFLNNGSLGEIANSDKLQAIVFSLENDRVSGVENEILSNKNINYLTLWCLSKGISEIYVQNIALKHKIVFKKLEITVKTADELSNDYLYNTLILRNNDIKT